MTFKVDRWLRKRFDYLRLTAASSPSYADPAIFISLQRLPPHVLPCSFSQGAAQDVAAAAVNFDALNNAVDRSQAICDLRQLAEIKVVTARINSSGISSTSISTSLCISAQDAHRLLLPIFWGKNPLAGILFLFPSYSYLFLLSL